MKAYVSICFAVLTILSAGGFCPAAEEKNHVCFKVIDADSNGKITFQEFARVFGNEQEKFATIDRNGDGTLSHDEYHQSLGHGAETKAKTTLDKQPIK